MIAARFLPGLTSAVSLDGLEGVRGASRRSAFESPVASGRLRGIVYTTFGGVDREEEVVTGGFAASIAGSPVFSCVSGGARLARGEICWARAVSAGTDARSIRHKQRQRALPVRRRHERICRAIEMKAGL
jgi:hypothetical protein